MSDDIVPSRRVSRFFSQRELHRLYQTVLHAQIEPGSLLAEVDASLRATLETNTTTQANALLTTLCELNTMTMADGSIPFRTVLRTARLLSAERVQSEVFGEALKSLDDRFPDADKCTPNLLAHRNRRRGSRGSPLPESRPSAPTHRLTLPSHVVMPAVVLAFAGALLVGLLCPHVVFTKYWQPTRETHTDSSCGEQRQWYAGSCLSNRMVDFLVCLDRNGASQAWLQATTALRSVDDRLSHSDAQDAVRQSFSSLSESERRLITVFCKDVADRAGVSLASLPQAPPEARRAEEKPKHISAITPTCAAAGEEVDYIDECCSGKGQWGHVEYANGSSPWFCSGS